MNYRYTQDNPHWQFIRSGLRPCRGCYGGVVADHGWLVDWLPDSGLALRWRVQRDLAGAARETWGATGARISTEGFGARLLALQDPDGTRRVSRREVIPGRGVANRPHW